MWKFLKCGKIMANQISQNNKPIKKNYWKEILCLLIVKAVLLTGLWYVCFKDPIVMDDKTAGEHIFH
ncbi:MAG: hypothetical protein RLZZ293_644 [Pseudomonadota bacterium]|jgi:hypothetical protein